MKKNLRVAALFIVLAVLSLSAVAQTKETRVNKGAKWVPEKGYWVIEHNIKSPQISTVYFYDNQNLLLYSEKVEGLRLNVKRTRTLKLLKELLDQSYKLQETARQTNQHQQLVKNMFTNRD